MTRTGIILAAGLAATVGLAADASAQAVHAGPGAYPPAHHPYAKGRYGKAWHRHARPAPVHAYGYSWQPGQGWYVSWRPRLPPARYGVVPVAGPVPYGAYGPVGWATPAQDGTIYATDARRIYAYPTYVVPAATVTTYGTGCVGMAGCAWTLGGWR